MGYSVYCYCILIAFVIIIDHVNSISDLRICANEDCSTIVSHGKTVIKYIAGDEFTLSFDINQDVIIYSKSAGIDKSLWGVSINGVRGYAPKQYIKETKILNKIQFEVPTEYYKEVNGVLLPIKNKFKSKKDKSNIVKDNNQKEIPNVENVVLDPNDNSEVIVSENIESTDQLDSHKVINKPAILDRVSGEIMKDDINASPSYLVIDGTTMPPNFGDDIDNVQFHEKSVQLESKTDGNQNIETTPEASEEKPNERLDESKSDNDLESQTIDVKDAVISPPDNLNEEVEVTMSSDSETKINHFGLSDDLKSEINIHPKDRNGNTNETNLDSEIVDDSPSKIELAKSLENDVNDILNEDVHEKDSNTENNLNSTANSNSENDPKLNIDSSQSNPESSPEMENDIFDSVKLNMIDSVVTDKTSDVSAADINPLNPKNQDDHNIPQKPLLDQPSAVTNSPAIDNTKKFENIFSSDESVNDEVVSPEVVEPSVDIINSTEEELMKVPVFNENFYLIPPLGSPPIMLNQDAKVESEHKIPVSESYEDTNNTSQEILSHENLSDTTQSTEYIMMPPTEPPNILMTPGSSDDIPDKIIEDPVTEQYAESLIHTPSSDENVESVTQNEISEETQTERTKEIQDSTPLVDNMASNDYYQSNEDTESTDSGESFISSMLSNIGNSFNTVTNKLSDLFKSNNKEEEIEIAKPKWSEEKLPGDVDRVIVGWESFLASFLPAYSALPQCRPDENVIAMTEVSTDLVMWLVISAVSVLLFTLGYYFLENRKQDGKLLAMVNSLQKELLCSSKECILLKDELTITKEKLIGIEDSSFGSDEMVASLKKEIADAQITISELQDRLTQTEEELANSTEAALELQAILDDQLSSKDTSNSSLTFTVSNLQAQLNEQQTTMNLTKSQLATKVEENEVLMAKIVECGNRTTAMEKELQETQNQMRQAREECENKSQQLHELSNTMEKSLLELKNQKAVELKNLQSQLKNVKSELESSKVLLKARAHEVSSLQENFKLLKADGVDINAILDVSKTKAELTQILTEKNLLAEKYEKDQSLLNELTSKVEAQDNQMKQMREQLNEAEQNAIQATSRLEVLSTYFEKKEADYVKELNAKESLWLSQQGENMSTAEKIQNLQQEILQYKETAESVRRELAEQEATWRAKNSALEKRAHEQWLARRAAERQADASAVEAQSLRQRLAAPSPTDKPQGMVSPLNSVEGIGDLPLLPPPPLPFPPFPPMGGLPPPPFLPPLLPTHRPPPLGRLSSPPPLPSQHMRHDRYSPDSRYSPDRDRDYSPDRRSTPQRHRGRSPYSQDSGGRRRQYNNNSRRYNDDDRYYDSGEDRRSHRRYEETETDISPPPSPPMRRAAPRNHKGISSGSGQSSESLERISKHSSNKY